MSGARTLEGRQTLGGVLSKVFRCRSTLLRSATNLTAPKTTAVMDPGSAIKWVSTNAEAKLNVSPAATNLLVSRTRPAAPVNLVSILGPARHGKSSLMNTVVGTGGTFAMSDSVEACTKGGDLS